MIQTNTYRFKRYIAGVDDAALAGAAATVIAGGTSAVAQGSMNRKTRKFNAEQAEIQRKWSEKMYNEQNAWNLEMWNKQNEYNSPAQQLQRLRDAGLNPLYYGLDGTSAGNISAAQPLGYERASADNQVNPVGVGIETASQLMSLQKDIQLKNKQLDKMDEETNALKLDNEFKDKTMEARTEAEQLKNSLTKEQIGEAKSRIEVNEKNAKKLEEEAKTEVERRAAVIAQKLLTEANTKEVLEMLPYKKLLAEAQTEAQKANAAAAWAKAAIDKGLLDAGYVDKQIDAITAQVEKDNALTLNAKQQAELNEWKVKIRTGQLHDIESDDSVIQKILKGTANVVAETFAQSSEIALGGLKL